MVTCGQIRPRVWGFVYINTNKISRSVFNDIQPRAHLNERYLTSVKEKTFAATKCHVIHFTIENKLSAEVIFPGTIARSIVQGACNFAPTVTYQTAGFAVVFRNFTYSTFVKLLPGSYHLKSSQPVIRNGFHPQSLPEYRCVECSDICWNENNFVGGAPCDITGYY